MVQKRLEKQMSITYWSPTLFPHCKYCGEPMHYRIIGLPDENHAHAKCKGKALANESFNALLEKRKAQNDKT